jgi:hypothetical protein
MYRDLESELKNGESRAQAPITVLHTRTVVALPRFCLWETANVLILWFGDIPTHNSAIVLFAHIYPVYPVT